MSYTRSYSLYPQNLRVFLGAKNLKKQTDVLVTSDKVFKNIKNFSKGIDFLNIKKWN